MNMRLTILIVEDIEETRDGIEKLQNLWLPPECRQR
jgi:hypothetical protein